MSLATRAQSLVIDVDRPGNPLRSAWDLLNGIPGGKALVSRMLGQAAPYTGSIGARIVELREGYARVEMTDRRAVRNHLDCVHAIALANLAEVTGNAAMAYGLADDGRFIVAGMSIDYVKKARGTITGETHAAVPDASVDRTIDVPVVLKDAEGEVVARATLSTKIGPKKSRA